MPDAAGPVTVDFHEAEGRKQSWSKAFATLDLGAIRYEAACVCLFCRGCALYNTSTRVGRIFVGGRVAVHFTVHFGGSPDVA
ncbi:MAG TPA: hypothetical protein DCQ64_23995 [Candidatus Rokubacteria bacterium]|nr:hypothetical protein [Candidatus Rokubacteria bacterium]